MKKIILPIERSTIINDNLKKKLQMDISRQQPRQRKMRTEMDIIIIYLCSLKANPMVLSPKN